MGVPNQGISVATIGFADYHSGFDLPPVRAAMPNSDTQQLVLPRGIGAQSVGDVPRLLDTRFKGAEVGRE